MKINSAAVLSGPGAFRFMLALIVILGHFTRLNFGTAAVYVFFMLSGYWIQKMWVARYSRARTPWRTFMLSRVWRLLPVFILCSTAALLTQQEAIATQTATIWESTHLLISSFFILGYNSLAFRPLWTAWSLDVELQFYAIAPFVAALLVSRFRRLLILSSITIGLVSAVLFGDMSALSYLPFFLLGAFAAHDRWAANRTAVRVSVMVVLLVLLGIAMTPHAEILLGGSNPSPAFLRYNPTLQIIIGLVLSPIALASVAGQVTGFDKFLADLSYIVYLVHSIALTVLVKLVPEYPTDPYFERFLMGAITFAVILCTAVIIWYFIDAPLNRWRSSFIRRRVEAGGRSV